MQRQVGFTSILLVVYGLFALSARADDWDICLSAHGNEGIAACTRTIASGKFKNGELASAYYGRANARNAGGDIDGALADYDEAIRADPKLAAAYVSRGVARHKKGDDNNALVDFDRAVQLDSNNTNAYFIRGLFRQQKGNLDGALADYDVTIRLDPKNASAYNTRGFVRRTKGDLDGAIADYDQAIRLDANDASAYVNRGVVRQLKGNAASAMADYDQAIALDPNLAAGYNGKAWALFEAGRLNEALTPVERALQLKPNFDEALDTRGHIREALGDLAGALTDYKAALAINPGLKESQLGSARVIAQLQPAPSPAADAGRRVALVIGNSNYVNFPKIPNPRNDAEDLAAALRNLGFDVLLGTDLKRTDMEDIFIRFAKKARESDTALVFYAGHGLQHQGINYLAPIDANIEDETDLRKLVNLQNVIDDLQNAGQVRILIVDACRDNEVIKQLASRLPATRSAVFTRGLAAVSGADGTLIAFATQPNRVAADGSGRNSPFTQSLLKNLPTPGLELRTLMTRVRAEVVKATGGAQRPEVWDSLVGEFAFKSAQ